MNEQIHVGGVRVVGGNGSQVIPTKKALDLIRQRGIDLVEVSPRA